MITCLLPLFTIVLVKGIFKKTGVSSMFAMILELIPFFNLIALTSFKNREACSHLSKFVQNVSLCQKYIHFLKGIYIYIFNICVYIFFLSFRTISNNFIKIDVVEMGFNNFLLNSMKLINLF